MAVPDAFPTTITAAEARRLALLEKPRLNLSSLQSLDPHVARELSRFRGHLHLDGLTDLCPNTAHLLALHEGGCLSLCGLDVLLPEVAHSLADFKNKLFLDGLRSITDEASKELSLRRCDLSLNGLTTLTANAAMFLAQEAGWPLQLPRKAALPQEVRHRLAKMRGKSLRLDGITNLTPDAEEMLAKHTGKLSLDGLGIIRTVALAKRMARSGYRLNDKWLPHLNTVEVQEVCRAIAATGDESGGATLTASSLETLSLELAAALATFEGETLELDGLSQITTEVADILATCKCSRLSLRGIVTLPAATARSLAAFKGHLSLGGLRYIDASVEKELAACRGTISARGLESLKDAEFAVRLIDDEGCLELEALTFISDEAAEKLADLGCYLDFSSLPTLSQRMAKAVAKHRGRVNLPGLRTLSSECALALASFAGDYLHLGHPETASPAAFESLRRNTRIDIRTPLEAAAEEEAFQQKIRKLL